MGLEYLYLLRARQLRQMRLPPVLTFYSAHKYSVNAVTDAALVIIRYSDFTARVGH